jgi:hypothetical protein
LRAPANGGSNQSNVLNSERIFIFRATRNLRGWLMVLLSLAGFDGDAQTLHDANSSVTIGTGGAGSWTVDGNNVLNKELFFYQAGSGVPSGLDNSVVSQSSTGPGSQPVLTTTFTSNPADPSFKLQVTYTLTGGAVGSGESILQESVRLINTSLAPLNFNLFQYADFNLNNPSASLFQNASHTLFNDILITGGPGMGEGMEAAMNPGSVSGEISSDGSLLTRLVSTPSGYQLADNASAGGVSWSGSQYALEWEFRNILPGGSRLLGETFDVEGIMPIPESGTWGAAGIGFTILGAMSSIWRRTGRK